VFLFAAVYVLLGSLAIRGWSLLRPMNAVPASATGGTTVRKQHLMPWAVPIALAVWSIFIYSNVFGK
jgi:hypothetical protein